MIAKGVAVLKIISFVCFTPLMMLTQLLVLRLGIGNPKTIPQLYNKGLCKILGLQITIEGPHDQRGLIVANHISWADILVFNATSQVSLIAKKEVGSWPLFGALAKLQNTIFVDRDSKMSSQKSLDAIAQRLKSGDTLVLFPESTTHNGKQLLPFKSTLFAAAMQLNTPIIPATLIYQCQHRLPLTMRQRPAIAWYGDIDLAPHLWKAILAGPIHAHLIFHNKIEPDKFENRKHLSAYCYALIAKTLADNLHVRP